MCRPGYVGADSHLVARWPFRGAGASGGSAAPVSGRRRPVGVTQGQRDSTLRTGRCCRMAPGGSAIRMGKRCLIGATAPRACERKSSHCIMFLCIMFSSTLYRLDTLRHLSPAAPHVDCNLFSALLLFSPRLLDLRQLRDDYQCVAMLNVTKRLLAALLARAPGSLARTGSRE